ncbi:hypothetical protein [Microlunatus antarcticus]|uniref:Asp23 family, cell envelope-related function n=1 Tax=Microlunatus antarcticus TaxID=53388 RepID=A0A7W5JW64_9ACTN|nr:hypothetical protein [Microlunatus antarcticus]MBB3327433.1 hypothetical protein [Microlunatus antarcticus]
MSTPEVPGPATAAELRAATDELRDGLAGAAEAISGVVRLEPTLRNALRRLHVGSTVLLNGKGARSAADGIELHRRADVVDVHVDVVTDPTRSAAAIARDVRRALVDELATRRLRAGSVTVAVLSVER